MKRVLVLAVTGLAVAAFTTPAAQAKSVATTHLAATTADAARAVTAFWTPERMRSAQPLDLINVAPKSLKDVARGLPAIVPQSFPNGGAVWTGGGAVTRTAGRVFFTYQGRTASCSGNAVTSANKNTVMTAGHCVKLDGAFHTNWVFVPGYDSGNTPYGTWTAKSTHATPQWAASEDINYDIGAAVVNPLNGQNLTDVVGSQGIAFNQPRGQNMYAFGYSAAAPYDGSKLIYCSGQVFNDFLLSQGIGMTCNQTGGSSGGPWFLSFSEATGTGVQNSVNSFKYNFFPNWMFGPYFGTDAQNLYNSAQAS
ncbi:serine protease [Kibdelosporangium persicum]|uniref:Extracellular metalloprotease n=1 Tax=Kibdelosporangium persicum TaxID=2698649 RepID=A0ABX2F9E8_9PSEU|nr:peptidase [Kibdelosporangium persicum]NRN67532.1 Extracellular metalloprotease [Kibdelosporangium persicum]